VALQYEGACVAELRASTGRRGGPARDFHDLALYRVARPELEDRRQRAGMNHVALAWRGPDEVDRAAEFWRQGDQGC